MSNLVYMQVTTRELCEQTHCSVDTVIEWVELGIIDAQGSEPEHWLFDLKCVSTARRAARLQRDLGIDWHAVAIILDLLDQRDRLRIENDNLQQRLARFLSS